MYVVKNKNTLEVKIFNTQLVLIYNTTITNQKFQRNPKILTFDFSRLQIYLRPGKVPFVTMPKIRLVPLNE